MLKIKLDKRKKVLIIAGAVLLFMGLIYRFSPVEGIKERRDEIAMKQRKLAKYHQVLQGKEPAEARLISLNQMLSRYESGLLTEATEALAAVDIQNLLTEIAASSSLNIQTMRVLKAKSVDESGYVVIPVQFTIISTIAQLEKLLYRIEASPRLLAINQANIAVINPRDPDKIKSTLTVAGLMKQAET